MRGYLAESNVERKRSYRKQVDLQIPIGIDSTELYKDFAEIYWLWKKTKYGIKQKAAYISMIELTSKITNSSSAELLLFQILFHTATFKK